MEVAKSPLKANYCRLPVTRAEKLFDQVVTKSTLSDISNNFIPRGQDYTVNRKRSPGSAKSKRKVQFATYDRCKGKKEVRKKTCAKKKESIKSTKEAVLEAFLNAGLPDYDAIASLPLNVVVMDNNRESEKKSESISKKQIIKPFIPLLRRIDSRGIEENESNESNPAINVQSPSNVVNEDIDEPVIVDSASKEEASTPLANGKPLPQFNDISFIEPNKTTNSNLLQEPTFLTPKGPPPKKKPWNVTDRRGTALLPPHPVVFEDPLIITNTSLDVSDDQPLDWSNVQSVSVMDQSVHNVFSIDTKVNLKKKIRESMDSMKANQKSHHHLGTVNYYRRSIFETASILHALGKSCRTIVREPPPRRSTRKRKEPSSENQAINFLVAFDKTFIEDIDEQVPLTTKDKVLALCRPPQITTFSNAIDQSLIKSISKIGEGSYGEVFKSKFSDDQEVVLKIVHLMSPSEVDDVEDTWAQILPELVISLTFGQLRTGERNRSPNFINTLRASCVSGVWPKELVNAWDEYHKLNKSENNHPDSYGPESNWLIILLNNGGIEIDIYQFNSATQALSVILQVALSLAAAEEEFEFEHRDLHTGNVLIMPCTESEFEYKIDGKDIKLPSVNLQVSVIDFTLARMSKDGYIVYDDLSKYEDLFTGVGDYQFEIYRLMRQANSDNWKDFTPYTNILWVHYLTLKLITDKKYKSRSKAHYAALKALKSLKDNLLSYKSTKQFVQSSYFKTIISKLS